MSWEAEGVGLATGVRVPSSVSGGETLRNLSWEAEGARLATGACCML